MPRNKTIKGDDQRNDARFRSRPLTPSLDKMARRPSSLNHINKNLP